MPHIALIGAGKIGKLAAELMARRYNVTVYDLDERREQDFHGGKVIWGGAVDTRSANDLTRAIEGKDLVVSCCPYFCNKDIALVARKLGTAYCDLAEDIETGLAIERIAEGSDKPFIPHCGLAPGFTQIIASYLVRHHTPVTNVSIRVGALPENPTNALKYNLTWSTDGLINEYGNACEVLSEGRLKQVQPLEGYERLIVGETELEAFNTSGGLGTLARSLEGQVTELSYKTLRYVGHRDLMKFLMFDLQLNVYREILKQILESAVPTTDKDKVFILVSVVGRSGGSLHEHAYTRVIPHADINGTHWNAIQITTASSVAAVVELCLEGQIQQKGLVLQEEIDYEAFTSTQPGALFT